MTVGYDLALDAPLSQQDAEALVRPAAIERYGWQIPDGQSLQDWLAKEGRSARDEAIQSENEETLLSRIIGAWLL